MSQQNQSRMVQQYTLDEDEAPSEGVYTVVAAVENCSPLDLTPLAKATDPDALDALFTAENGTDHVSFEYCGYAVTATSDKIRVEEPISG